MVVFDYLLFIFVIGIVIGILKDSNGVVGLLGVILYLMFDVVIKIIDKINNMVVFGGIIVGLIVGYIYNCFKDIKLFEYFGFFSGRWFVLIVIVIIMIILVGIFGVVWLLI